MVWTYSGDPAASDLDAVRFLLGDTVEASAIFQDEELEWVLTQASNVYIAASIAAESAASAFEGAAGDVKTKTVGALSISYDSEKAEKYRKLSRQLRFQGALHSTIVPYSGGISKADKETQEDDTDWVRPNFSIGMHDNEGTQVTDWST